MHAKKEKEKPLTATRFLFYSLINESRSCFNHFPVY